MGKKAVQVSLTIAAVVLAAALVYCVLSSMGYVPTPPFLQAAEAAPYLFDRPVGVSLMTIAEGGERAHFDQTVDLFGDAIDYSNPTFVPDDGGEMGGAEAANPVFDPLETL